MDDDRKGTSSKEKVINESKDASESSKFDEMITVLKSIDDKLVSILRIVQEINRRG